MFARVLLGHLNNDPDVGDADLITPMPAVDDQNGGNHAARIVWFAELYSCTANSTHRYPFDSFPPVIRKTRKTPEMAYTTSRDERLATARDIYDALVVSEPDRVWGKTVIVVDNVFTTGLSLNAVARRLKEHGAQTVRGLTIARQPLRR